MDKYTHWLTLGNSFTSLIYPPLLFIQRATYLISWAERPLHVMQAIRHGVDGINDKPHLGVLCVLLPEGLSLCRGGEGVGGGERKQKGSVYQRNPSSSSL